MKKKVLAVFLAVVMALSCLPFAFAEDAETNESADRVVAWADNYDFLEEKLLDSTTYTHYQYVVDNSKEIQTNMTVYTAFGLYDNAITNAFDKKADIETCKKILVSMVEKYQANVGKDYVAEITKVLSGAKDAAGLLEKLNGLLEKYTDALSFVNSDTWGTVFGVVDFLINAGKAYSDIRTGLINAYARIMSIQLTNGYYVEMVQYVADHTDYAPMRRAAQELVTEASRAVEEQLASMVEEATRGQVNNVINSLLNLAVNSNVYTATAMKVFNIAGSVANVLWNTNNQYDLYSQLVAAYHAENAIVEYTQGALDTAAEEYVPERALFAVNGLIAVRSFGESSMYQLKVAQAGGIVGKVKSKLYNTIFTQYTANQAELNLMYECFYNTAIADMTKITEIDKIYCPVDVTAYAGTAKKINVPDKVTMAAAKVDGGYATTAYSAYNKDYVKVLFLEDAIDNIVLKGTGDGYVTFVKYVDEDGKANDYSFTEKLIHEGETISVKGMEFSYAKDGQLVTESLSDDYVIPEGKTPTAKEVADAVVEVGKDEAKSFLQKIKDFFNKIFEAIRNLFKIKK